MRKSHLPGFREVQKARLQKVELGAICTFGFETGARCERFIGTNLQKTGGGKRKRRRDANKEEEGIGGFRVSGQKVKNQMKAVGIMQASRIKKGVCAHGDEGQR